MFTHTRQVRTVTAGLWRGLSRPRRLTLQGQGPPMSPWRRSEGIQWGGEGEGRQPDCFFGFNRLCPTPLKTAQRGSCGQTRQYQPSSVPWPQGPEPGAEGTRQDRLTWKGLQARDHSTDTRARGHRLLTAAAQARLREASGRDPVWKGDPLTHPTGPRYGHRLMALPSGWGVRPTGVESLHGGMCFRSRLNLSVPTPQVRPVPTPYSCEVRRRRCLPATAQGGLSEWPC